MKKIKIEVEEKVVYKHTIEVECNNDNQVEKAMNKLESEGNHPDDVVAFLVEQGVKILNYDKDDLNSPDSINFECIDIEDC